MSKLKLLDFYAEWCGPCVTLKPIIKEIKEEYGDKIEIEEVNVDENSELSGQYQISSIPTLILLDEKGEVVWRQSGMITKLKLLEKLNL